MISQQYFFLGEGIFMYGGPENIFLIPGRFQGENEGREGSTPFPPFSFGSEEKGVSSPPLSALLLPLEM